MASILAFVLIKVTGVDREVADKIEPVPRHQGSQALHKFEWGERPARPRI